MTFGPLQQFGPVDLPTITSKLKLAGMKPKSPGPEPNALTTESWQLLHQPACFLKIFQGYIGPP